MGLLVYDKDQSTFIFKCTPSERFTAKGARFIWDPDKKIWHQPNFARASRLIEFATESAKKEIQRRIGFEPYEGDIIVKKGVEPMEHQFEAARFAMSRKHSYIAGDPGTGKTLSGILVADTMRTQFDLEDHWPEDADFRVAVVCPAFLALNWEEEIYNFSKFPEIQIASGMKSIVSPAHNWVIIPDSIIHSEEIKKQIIRMNWDLVLIDEAHRFKNERAKRTCAVLGDDRKRTNFSGLVGNAKKVVCLSGTPMPSRNVDLFSILSKLAPHTIGGMNYLEYGLKYCGAHQTEYGWDFSGSTNTEQLHKKVIGSFMLRQDKDDCLDLPQKVIQFKTLPVKMKVRDQKKMASFDDAWLEDIIGTQAIDPELATLRAELGLFKAEASIDYIINAVEESGKVLVFAWHKEAIKHLQKELSKEFEVRVIDGSVPMRMRHHIVNEFQSNKKVKVVIGQISCMVGITLTAAWRGVFVESSWVPGDNDQAMDRMHRIGQTEKVVIDFLRVPNDLDERVFKMVKHKQSNIKKFLKGEKKR